MNKCRSEVVELPPYRALLVVDVKNFSGEKGRDHARITRHIPVILEQALIRCGLGELRERVRFEGSTGDGYFWGFDPAFLPFLLNPFLAALQDELEYQNKVNLGSDRQYLRMRVSINVGPMTDSGGNDISDGSGDARIETHRLLDSKPVRDMLTRSTSTTCVAAIISRRVYEDAIVSGYAADAPELYVPVDVEVKTYCGTAYLRVPKPSGDLLASGFTPPEPAGTGPSAEADDVEGSGSGVQQQESRSSIVGITHVQGGVGTAITGHQPQVHVGRGDQFNAPLGDGVNIIGTNRGRIRHHVNKSGDQGDGR
ncbi:hypothetical protein GCM10011581_06110 [Saccharopolyspora subtropica]|uniref:Guanylate cyclase domain-containing protein n=1 Tax=Saccharopolyspora thermophila TaxID=89367 RepID=A0A917JLU2_9PSEU|nr:hypothetical protein [Saccharopolyspora subtropica]GGI71912.1 hypothetical protein GCM10011581_06110 [Saccharopolyspora subtropica]